MDTPSSDVANPYQQPDAPLLGSPRRRTRLGMLLGIICILAGCAGLTRFAAILVVGTQIGQRQLRFPPVFTHLKARPSVT